jgi:hypothetical protein
MRLWDETGRGRQGRRAGQGFFLPSSSSSVTKSRRRKILWAETGNGSPFEEGRRLNACLLQCLSSCLLLLFGERDGEAVRGSRDARECTFSDDDDVRPHASVSRNKEPSFIEQEEEPTGWAQEVSPSLGRHSFSCHFQSFFCLK